MITFAKVTGK